jgi:hypothetical protein
MDTSIPRISEAKKYTFFYKPEIDFTDVSTTDYCVKTIVTILDVPANIWPADVISTKSIIEWWGKTPAYQVEFHLDYRYSQKMLVYKDKTDPWILNYYPTKVKIDKNLNSEEVPERFKEYGRALLLKINDKNSVSQSEITRVVDILSGDIQKLREADIDTKELY